MRGLGEDRGRCELRLLIETDEDLWHLYNIIETGDLITASTPRREEKQADRIRAERAEKKRMTLGVRIEKIEFSDEDLRLKLLGTIETGPQDIGQHHTLIFENGDSLLISKKKWKESQFDRVRRAVEEAKKPHIVFVSLDQDEATIAVLRQYGLKEIASLQSGRSGKQYSEKNRGDTYHSEIIEKLKTVSEPGMPTVLLGPGFEKELLAESLKAAGTEKLFVYHTGQTGMAGINELLKTGMGADLIRESSVGTEIEAVEELMTLIGRNGPATYGTEQIMNAAMSGAVEKLLILDSVLRSRDCDELIRSVESQKGTVLVISGQHDGGKELAALGGMGAVLRYKTDFL